MLSPVGIEETMGYKIEIGETDVFPRYIRSSIDNINNSLNQYKDLRIVSNNDYIYMSDKLKITKGFSVKINELEVVLLKPVKDLENRITGGLYPVRQNCNDTIFCMKKIMLDWSTEVKRKRHDEKAEKLRKAKEEEVIIKRVLQEEATEEQKKADLLETQRKTEIEKRRDLEIKKIGEEKKIGQIAKQVDDAKEKLNKDPNNAEDIRKEIGILEEQKNTIGDIIKNVEIDIDATKSRIKSICKEENIVNIYARKLAVEKDALVVAPNKLLTEKVPKINGIVYAKILKYRITDINLVPTEWTNVTITVDNKKVKEALRLKGKNLKIPGIEVYEEDNLRSTSY